MSFLPTNDQWAGTYPGGFVEVKTMKPWPSPKGYPPTWRILISGNDDLAMYRDFTSVEAFEAGLRRLPVVIEQRTLEGLGYHFY